jgi:hypothetical protein
MVFHVLNRGVGTMRLFLNQADFGKRKGVNGEKGGEKGGEKVSGMSGTVY